MNARIQIAPEQIHFAFGTCWLGTVLVAVSAWGIAAILLGSQARFSKRQLSLPIATILQ